MKTVQFDMPTRLIVETILGQQRGTLSDMEVPNDILQRIKVTQDQRDTLFVTVRGQVIVDDAAIQDAEEISIDLEKEEVKRLLKILTEWPHVAPGDVKYLTEFVKVLST